MSELSIPQVLLITGDDQTAAVISQGINAHFAGQCVQVSPSVEQAISMSGGGFGVIILDLAMVAGADSELADLLRRLGSNAPVVVLAKEKSMVQAALALRHGAAASVIQSGESLALLPGIVEQVVGFLRLRQENQALRGRLEAALQEIQNQKALLEEAARRYDAMAGTDPLTGLSNRRSLDEALERSFAEATRYGHDLACVMIDLDNFKLLNDSLGHLTGDKVLSLMANILRVNCRRSDTAGRYGGDEFLLLLPQTELPTACGVARRICEHFTDQLRQTCRQAGLAPDLVEQIGVSVGVATLRKSHPADPEGLVAQADQALYRAKQLGKGRVEVYDHARPDPMKSS